MVEDSLHESGLIKKVREVENCFNLVSEQSSVKPTVRENFSLGQRGILFFGLKGIGDLTEIIGHSTKGNICFNERGEPLLLSISEAEQEMLLLGRLRGVS